ncbi:MAG TPA: fumarylacetoacetate hydrolase family protein [Methylocella sp.]|nr:fumarylacetoacetate hydrolase family protein [Methylocella sp.]
MGHYAFAPLIPSLPVLSGKPFPIRRIFCVGQNYRDHAKEMGGNPDADPPFFFMKPADAILQNGEILPYPPGTADLQHEAELVVALGKAGRDIPAEAAADFIFGYAAGLDMTKRDVQTAYRLKGRPWEMSKSFDFSAPCSAITPKNEGASLPKGEITCHVNGTLRQKGDLSQMIWGIADIIEALSRQVAVAPGDLIFTGTPAGVGPVVKGDRIEVQITGLVSLAITIG